jgi:putative transposase
LEGVLCLYKLTFKKRVWIVKQRLRGVSTSTVALSQQVSEGYVRRLMRIYNSGGFDGLHDYKTGRPETILNENAQIIILDLRKRFGYGACRIEQLLKQKGFLISHRQIEKVLLKNNQIVPNIKKQRPRKWVRYELPNPNDLWHTDWSFDPFTQKQFSVFLDDKTRLITSYGLFTTSSAEHSIGLLKIGIACCGKPKSVMTDHGSTYYANHPNAQQENTQWKIALNNLGIKHYITRVNRPQTNGKVERFFLSYKTEYTTGSFRNIKDYIEHYNKDRPHMSLNYKTPQQVWDYLKTEPVS